MIAISHSDSVHLRVDLKIIKLKFVICVRWTWSMCYQESILYSCKIISNGQLSLISQLKPIICLHLSEPQNVTFIYRYQCFQKKSRTITRFIYFECECEKKNETLPRSLPNTRFPFNIYGLPKWHWMNNQKNSQRTER